MNNKDLQMFWCYWDDYNEIKRLEYKLEENESDTKQVSS